MVREVGLELAVQLDEVSERDGLLVRLLARASESPVHRLRAGRPERRERVALGRDGRHPKPRGDGSLHQHQPVRDEKVGVVHDEREVHAPDVVLNV